MKAMLRTLVPLVCAAALAGCGGGGGDEGAGAPAGTSASGASVFAEAGCGKCHTLSAAGSKGEAGPNLDQLRPSAGRVERQVERGGGGMPSFRGRLSGEEIRAVARFVADETARSRASVAAAFKPTGTKLSDCRADQRCFEQAFANLAYRRGPKAALATFVREMATNPFVEQNCHRIAHALGAGALTRLHGDVGKAFAAGSAACWSGYYHGILERAFQGVPDSRIGAVARRLCSSPSIRRTTFVAYQCVHGLGHGLMIYTGYDLPLALRVCDRLATGWDQTSCTGGVFMENQSSSYGIRSRWLRRSQPLYPCTSVAERHKLYCYLMVTSQVLPDVGFSWGRTAATCRRAEARWVATCFQSYGRDASGQTRGDVRAIGRICRVAGDMERECLFGAARDLTSNDANGVRAARVCDAAPAAARAYCFYGIGTILGTLFAASEQRAAACERVAGSYLRRCAAGADGYPFRP